MLHVLPENGNWVLSLTLHDILGLMSLASGSTPVVVRTVRNMIHVAYYPMILTHCPFVPTPDSEHWDSSDRGLTSYKGDTAYFGGIVSYTDKIVGKLIAKLDKEQLLK